MSKIEFYLYDISFVFVNYLGIICWWLRKWNVKYHYVNFKDEIIKIKKMHPSLSWKNNDVFENEELKEMKEKKNATDAPLYSNSCSVYLLTWVKWLWIEINLINFNKIVLKSSYKWIKVKFIYWTQSKLTDCALKVQFKGLEWLVRKI